MLTHDPLSEAGALAMLAGRDLLLLPGSRFREARVAIVITGTVHEPWPEETAAEGVPVILVLTEAAGADPVMLARLGVRACVRRADISPERLLAEIAAVRETSFAQPASDPEICLRLTDDLDRFPDRTPLTAREIDVLRLVARGLGAAEIAERLQYSERTVRNALSGVTSRLGLLSRTHSVAHALRAGLL